MRSPDDGRIGYSLRSPRRPRGRTIDDSPLHTLMTSFQIPQATDTSTAVVDSLQASFDRIGEGVTDTGRLLLTGRWEMIADRLTRGTADLLISSVPSLLSALFVGTTFYILLRITLRVTEGVLERSRGVDRGLQELTLKTTRVLGWGLIALLVLSQLGINLSALIAGLGIAGLAVGFAAKDSLENFISGITIMLDRPFKVGDWVTVGGHYGQVSEITLRSTRLVTLNHQIVVFPSLDMVTQPVVNHSARGILRVEVPFGIAYKERIVDARRVVMGLISDDDARLARSADHRVVTTGLNDSSVDLALHLYLPDPGDAVPVRMEYTEKIRVALGEAGIEIPFPHLQLFIDGARALEHVHLPWAPGASEGGPA